MKRLITIALIVVGFSFSVRAVEPIAFPSGDGLLITADAYLAHQDAATPLIVLFHQAGWSRGEYLEIAPRLNELGFSCLAVDLRSGGKVKGVANQTAAAAEQAGLPTTYVDALPDVTAALHYARAHLATGRVLAWGSSYSAALVLKVAGDQPGLADAVLAFAPGEYFTALGKPGDWIESSARHIRVPVFVTSARKEREAWSGIYEAVPLNLRTAYLPTTGGNHGSRALWRKFADSDGYWSAVRIFLDESLSE